MGLSGDRLREENKLFIMKQVSKERPKLLSLIICKRDCQSFGKIYWNCTFRKTLFKFKVAAVKVFFSNLASNKKA